MAVILASMLLLAPLHQMYAVPPEAYIIEEHEPELVYDAFADSYLTEENIAVILSGTALEGTETAFYDLERNYGVNAIFAIAAAHLESGLGASDLARYRCNLFGLRNGGGWSRFSSVESCIEYFGELMTSDLYAGKSIDEIGSIYCGSGWADKVRWLMDYNFNRLEEEHGE